MNYILYATINCCVLIVVVNAGENVCVNKPSKLSQQCVCFDRGSNFGKCNWTRMNIDYIKAFHEGDAIINVRNLISCSNAMQYRVELLIDETVNGYEECRHKHTSLQWNKHSEVIYEVDDSQQCQACRNHKPTVSFDYVFTGCYLLVIYNGNPKYMLYQSRPTFISTNYTKKRLVDKDVINIQRHFREKKELEIVVIFNSTHIRKPPSMSSLLIENPCKDKCLELEGMTVVDYAEQDPRSYKEDFAHCTTSSNITWSCRYSKDFINRTLYTCVYSGLNSSNNYGFRYKLLDEHTRCSEESVWATLYESCGRTFYFEFPRTVPVNISHDLPEQGLEAEYIAAPILAVLLMVILMFAVKHLCRSRSNEHKAVEAIQPAHNLLLNDEDSDTEVLLVYARDLELFSEIVENFKELLRTVNRNTSVLDINEFKETINADPCKWMLREILDEKVKIVLILNNCGSKIYEDDRAVYKNPKCQDNRFLYMIKNLKIATTRSYSNLFVVEVSGTLYDSAMYGDLNPAARYIMPFCATNLLETIYPNGHGYDPQTFNRFVESCVSYREYCLNNPNYVSGILEQMQNTAR